MQIPEYLVTGLTNFFTQLTQLMLKAGCDVPVKNGELIEPLDKDSDFANLQHSYIFIWVILENMLPVLRDDQSSLWDKGNAIRRMAGEFKLDAHLAAIDISGKWSYYAASEFTATMDELAKKFETDETISHIRTFFGFFGFQPNKLVSDIADKLRKKMFVQDGYRTLCSKIFSLKKSLENLDHTSCFKITPENADSDLITAKCSEGSIIKQLEIQQKALEAKEKERIELGEKITEFVNELPKKMLVINEKGEHAFEDAPDLTDTLKSSVSLKEVIENKLAFTTKMLFVLKANNTYFQEVYDSIVNDILSPLEKTLPSTDSQTYSSEMHTSFSSVFLRLEKTNFSDSVKQENILHSEYAKASATIQKNFSDLLDKQKEELAEKIKAKQKKCFNYALTQGMEAALTVTCKEKLDELALKEKTITECKDDEKKLDALQTFYNEHADLLKKQSNPKELAAQWVAENKFQDDVAIQHLLTQFFTEAAYKDFCSSIGQLVKSVTDAIAKGQIKVESANTAKIEKLKVEAEAKTKKIDSYKIAFDKVSQTAQQQAKQHQAVYQEEAEKRDRINDKVKQLLQERKTVTDQLKKGDIADLDSIAQLQKTLSAESIYSPIRSAYRLLRKKGSPERTELDKITSDYKSNLSNKKTLETLKSQIVEAFETEKANKESNSFAQNFSGLVSSSIGKSFDPILEKLSKSPTLLGEYHQKIIDLLKIHKSIKTFFKTDEDKITCTTVLDEEIEKQNKNLKLLEDKVKNSESDFNNKIKKPYKENYESLKKIDAQLKTILDNSTLETNSALQTLAKEQGLEIQTTYAELSSYLPENTVISTGQEYPTHRKNLAIMTCDLNLLKAKLGLFELKRTLNNVHTTLAAIDVQSTAFEYKANTPDLFANQWEIHARQAEKAIRASKEKIVAITVKLTEAEAEAAIANLTKELHSAHQILTQTKKEANAEGLPEMSDLSELLSTKDAIEKELNPLKQQIIEVKSLRQEKIIALLVQKNIYDRENKQAKTYQSILEKAEQYKNTIETEIEKLQSNLHQYPDTLVNDIIQGNVPAHFIPDQDNFYAACEQKCLTLETEINQLANQPIISDLDKAFSQALTQKITECKIELSNLSDAKTTRKSAWEAFSENNKLIRNSRRVIADGRANKGGYYDNYDLRRIQLNDHDFGKATIEGINFENAQLTRCNFSEQALYRTNFNNADVSTCNFDYANFEGVIVNNHTQIDWKKYGYAMLRDNLANPYTHVADTQETYLSQLIALVTQKCEGEMLPDNKPFSDWILDILKEIAQVPQPTNSDEKAHLHAQQQRAVFFMRQIVPHLSIDALLGLHDLVDKKHAEDNNPYGFIRRELDWFRNKYGNTDPWERIVMPIKERLQDFANNPGDKKLSDIEYQTGLNIMNTQTKHTYLLGQVAFFLTPASTFAQNWKNRKDALIEPSLDKKNQL